MAESSITVCVRIRPFSPKEQALLAPTDTYMPFLGDGGLSGGSPAGGAARSHDDAPGASPQQTLSNHLRPKLLRSIVTPVDDKVLIFDPPDNNPLTRLLSTPSYAPGAKRHKDMRYAFDRIFDASCGQYTVFEGTMKPLLDGVLNGYNASVFAYGATGCGKTHTISGAPNDPGVIFLTMKDLYQRIDDMAAECDVDIRVSYLEIYNETIRDLLSTHPTPAGQGLALREDSTNKISVVGITEHIPSSPEAILELLSEGNKRRTMSPTEANAVSSRSHAVLQVNVTQRPRTADTVAETTSASLNIIDLAGSERAAATRNNGARMKEGANINKSLLALGNCINALCVSDGRGKHVPYRNSKLTRLLKFSLGGNCRTVMIVCVSPSSAHYEETHNTLKYANQAKNIRTKISRNMLNVDRHVAQYVQAIHELKEEVAELKAKLAERGMLESVGLKRRRNEVRREVEEAKRRMTENVEGVRRMVHERAIAEAELDAAQAQLAPARARLAEIELALQREREEARANGVLLDSQFVPPPDLISERDLLRAMILVPAERRLADGSLVDAKRSLANSVHAAHGCVVAAANNSKFQPPPPPPPVAAPAPSASADGSASVAPAPALLPAYDPEAGPEKPAAEEVRNVGARLLAELERDRLEALYRASVAGRETDARKLCAMSGVVARTHAVLGEVVGQLEASGAEMGASNAELVAQLKAVLGLNERSFVELAGIRLELNLPAPASYAGVGMGALRNAAQAAAAPPAPAPTRARPSHGRRGRISLLGAPRAAVTIPASIEEGSPTSPPAVPLHPAPAPAPVSAAGPSSFSSAIPGPARQEAHREVPTAYQAPPSANTSASASASAVPAYMRATASSSAQARRRSSLTSHAVSRMARTGRVSNLSAHIGGGGGHGLYHNDIAGGAAAGPSSPSRRGPVGIARGPPPVAMAGTSVRGAGPSTGAGMSTRRVVSKTMMNGGSGSTAATGAGRRTSVQQGAGAVPPSPRRAPGAAAPVPMKKTKTFRWADEAGEGCLDDQGQGMIRFAAASTGPTGMLPMTNPGSSSPLSSPTKAIAPVRRRLTGLHPPAELRVPSDPDMSVNSTASATEWEDVAPVAPAPASTAFSTVLPIPPVSGGSSAGRRTGQTSMAAAAGSRAGMFSKAFLANNKAGATVAGAGSKGQHRSSLNGEDEDDQENSITAPASSSSSSRRRSSGLRDPLGELGNGSTAADEGDLLLHDLKVIDAQVPDSTLKSAPYRRESGGGGIGPVRRSKRRSSAGVALSLGSST
ncbi:tubulin-dependent ATPase kip3 [Tilletia horrida]|uniref:Tubulin-dependent ATPase kip3 n=1 Tax=Tilletia horrida TaxID=155126 RepID=A0AAN6G7R2_9BASI|nr:tubulin-dependent ATPase kip3 [Tilletia horrida]